MTSDADCHWLECSICGNTTECAAHEFEICSDKEGHWNECDVCGYTTEPVAHKFVKGECECGLTAAPQTGDTFNTALFTGMMLLSMTAAAALVLQTKKQKA